MAQSAQEMALDRGSEKGGGDPFAHDISHDDVEAVIGVSEKIIEVPVDLLRRNRERSDPCP